MKTAELRECTLDRLQELEKSLRREIFEARIKNLTGQLDDTASIRRAKRELARVQTIQRERVLGLGRVAAEAAGAREEP